MASYASRKRGDFESLTVIISVAVVVAISSLISTFPAWEMGASSVPLAKAYTMPAHLRNVRNAKPTSPVQGAQQAFRGAFGEPQSELEVQVLQRFQQGVSLLHAKRYDYAITALDAVLAISPNMPEAYVNMGYAFLGLEEFGPARNAFEKALTLKLDQVNAYYGLAIAFEGQGEFEGALGAMRTYIHLSEPDDPFLAKARAALWEWEAQLGRVKGVEVAPEGAKGATIKAPSWNAEHNPAP
jgi:tetratricopeptide (TPR) repeat protein